MSNISLAEMLQRSTLPAKPLQLRLLRQVAGQLDQAHQRALIHGNLTPQSILVSDLGTDGSVSAFVKDFSTRFDIDPAMMSGPPPPNAFYLSPEQVLGIDIGPQSDEFSFAVIAYEMISGSRPFTSPKLSGLIFSLCSDSPRPIDEVQPSLTPGVAYVFSRALARDRQGRYSTCTEFVSALEKELQRCPGWKEAERVDEHATIAVPAAMAAAAAASAASSNASAFIAGPPPPVAAAAPPAPAYEPIASRRDLPPQAQAPQEESLFRSEPRRFEPVQPNPQWNATRSFEPAADTNRSEYDLRPVRRRNRYEDYEEQPVRSGSSVKRFAIIGVIFFALAGLAAYLFSGAASKPNLPTQVLETKNAPVTPAPSSTDTATTPPSQTTQPAEKSQVPDQRAAPPPFSDETTQARVAQSQVPTPSQPARTAHAPASASAVQPQPQPRTQRATSGAAGVPRGGLVNVEFLSDPPGASILIDNNAALTCKAPCNISLSDGRHTLSASLPGYTVAQRIFNVPETNSLYLSMPKLTGALVVTSNPNAATILVDGKDYGLTPATLHLAPGPHHITLMNGSQRHDEVVNVVADGIQASGFTFPR